MRENLNLNLISYTSLTYPNFCLDRDGLTPAGGKIVRPGICPTIRGRLSLKDFFEERGNKIFRWLHRLWSMGPIGPFDHNLGNQRNILFPHSSKKSLRLDRHKKGLSSSSSPQVFTRISPLFLLVPISRHCLVLM